MRIRGWIAASVMLVMAAGAAAHADSKASPKRQGPPSSVPSTVSSGDAFKRDQAKVGPALQQVPYQKAVEALRSGRGPQVPPEQSRILSVTVNDGGLVNCGDTLRIKVRVLGGPKTPGLHWLSFTRTREASALPFQPPTNLTADVQVASELTISSGDSEKRSSSRAGRFAAPR